MIKTIIISAPKSFPFIYFLSPITPHNKISQVPQTRTKNKVNLEILLKNDRIKSTSKIYEGRIMFKVLDTTKDVIKKSKWVGINKEAIEKLARQWKKEGIKLPEWSFKYRFFDGAEKTLQYLLILNSLNFCFWPEPRWKIDFEGEKLDGSFALAVSLKRAIEASWPILEAKYLKNISEKDFEKIFQGEGKIPLFKERIEILRELGRVLENNYQGQFVNLLKIAKKDALKLIELLAKNFYFFRDEYFWQGKPVYFWKKAQLLVGDLHQSFSGKDWGEFYNLEELTAFADYKLPQILRYFGILVFSQELAEKVDKKILIPQGSQEEIEIRASTIWAIEFLKIALRKEKISLPSFKIDWILWNLAQKIEFPFPYHRTLTIFY